MKYKILALDLDGTLLSSKRRKISKENVQALSQFIDNGGSVCFVTGRSLTSSRIVADNFYKKTGKKIKYIACLNGTLIFDNVKEEYVEENTISPKIADKMLEECKKLKLGFATYTTKGMTEKKMQLHGYHGWNWLINLFNKQTKITKMKNVDLNDPIYKINVLKRFSNRNFKEFGNYFNNEFVNDLDISSTSPWLYEITLNNVNKGSAIEKISKLLNLDLSEVVAFGDSANDIPMFKKVGLPIAARDKYEHVLKYTKHVVNSKQKIAVAKGLEEYVFNEK